MFNILKVSLLFFMIVLFACSTVTEKERYLVLNYSDFGPPIIATELLGVGWWQWQAHGDSRPKDYDIKVIVYGEGDLNEVKSRYPVSPSAGKDFRYIEISSVRKYLDDNIRDNILENVTETLINTRLRIMEKF